VAINTTNKVLDFVLQVTGISMGLWAGLLVAEVGQSFVPYQGTLFGLHLQDLARVNRSCLLVIPCSTFILLLLNVSRFRKRRVALVFVLAIGCYFFFSMEVKSLGQKAESINMYEMFAVFSVFSLQNTYGYVLGFYHRFARRRIASSAVVICPLQYAHHIPQAGQKARWISRAMEYGMEVPVALLLVTTIRGFKDIFADESKVRRIRRLVGKRFGRHKVIVRSSAPDEDIQDRSQAGVYQSIADVDPDNVADAIDQVLSSYAERHIPDGQKVGLIIQVQVQAHYSGVAAREDASMGNPLLIEAARWDSNAVTAGEGAELWGRIGDISGQWISGALSQGMIKARRFTDAFFVLERKFPKSIEIEWCVRQGQMLLLQVRPAPVDISVPKKGTPAFALGILSPLLKQPYQRRTLLKMGELVDYQYGMSPAMQGFIDALYSFDGPQSRVRGRLYGYLAKVGPRPPLIHIFGGCYFNMLPRLLYLSMLLNPLIKTCNMFLRFRLGSVARRLAQDVQRSTRETSWQFPATTKDTGAGVKALAGHILEFQQEIIETHGLHVFQAGLLAKLAPKAGSAGPQRSPDPYFKYLSSDQKQRVPQNPYPYRAPAEYSIDHPRDYEKGIEKSHGQLLDPRFNHIKMASPSSNKAGEAIIHVQALARDNLSMAAYKLRLRYLLLGELTGLKQSIFNCRREHLEALSRGEPLDLPAATDDSPPPGLPVKFNLMLLERWAAGDVSSLKEPNAAHWVSGKTTRSGVVAWDVDAVILGDHPDQILVVQIPTVEIISKLPPHSCVIALGGSRLCHSAIIAREKKIHALFGASAFKDLLAEGNAVRVAENGRIKRDAI